MYLEVVQPRGSSFQIILRFTALLILLSIQYILYIHMYYLYNVHIYILLYIRLILPEKWKLITKNNN